MKEATLYILIVFLCQGCVLDPEQKDEQEPIDVTRDTTNSFIGCWESLKRVYPYESQLLIKNDGTFYFEYGACIAHGFSTGKWQLIDTSIFLNSNGMDSCMYLSYFGVDCIDVNPIDTAEYFIEKTIPDCNPKSESEYIEFKNTEFYIHNDTLRHIARDPQVCPEIRNDFIRETSNTTTSFGCTADKSQTP
jgi:hypothetical protein